MRVVDLGYAARFELVLTAQPLTQTIEHDENSWNTMKGKEKNTNKKLWLKTAAYFKAPPPCPQRHTHRALRRGATLALTVGPAR